MQETGNEIARKKWRSKWSEKDYREPDNSMPTAIRDFIRFTYKEKRWLSSDPKDLATPKPTMKEELSTSSGVLKKPVNYVSN